MFLRPVYVIPFRGHRLSVFWLQEGRFRSGSCLLSARHCAKWSVTRTGPLRCIWIVSTRRLRRGNKVLVVQALRPGFGGDEKHWQWERGLTRGCCKEHMFRNWWLCVRILTLLCFGGQVKLLWVLVCSSLTGGVWHHPYRVKCSKCLTIPGLSLPFFPSQFIRRAVVNWSAERRHVFWYLSEWSQMQGQCLWPGKGLAPGCAGIIQTAGCCPAANQGFRLPIFGPCGSVDVSLPMHWGKSPGPFAREGWEETRVWVAFFCWMGVFGEWCKVSENGCKLSSFVKVSAILKTDT